MSLVTPWGYAMTNGVDIPRLVSAEGFNELTAGKYANDARTEPIIEAACMGVRGHCGWHVYPSAECTFSERLLAGNGRLKRSGTDILIQLPAAYVTAISSVTVDGAETTDFDFETNGLVRIFNVYTFSVTRKTIISVEYTAGIPDALMGGIRELVVSRATRALTATNGVSSESAGGVTISYNGQWINSGGAGSLQPADAGILEPFVARGVF